LCGTCGTGAGFLFDSSHGFFTFIGQMASNKIGGVKVGPTKHGITITMNYRPAKNKGKDRLWVQIRQNSGVRWKVYTCLSYARSVDIQFVEDTNRQPPQKKAA